MKENENDQLDSTLRQAKRLHATFSEELRVVNEQIGNLEHENASLPNMIAPFEDLKQGVFDLIESAGKRWLNEKVRASVIDFATGEMGDATNYASIVDIGKPMRLRFLEGAINGTQWPEARAQLITRGQFDDLALFALFGDTLKHAISEAMKTITPEDMGYGKVTPSMIGPTRAEMNARIGANNKRIDELKGKKQHLEAELRKFNFKLSAD